MNTRLKVLDLENFSRRCIFHMSTGLTHYDEKLQNGWTKRSKFYDHMDFDKIFAKMNGCRTFVCVELKPAWSLKNHPHSMRLKAFVKMCIIVVIQIFWSLRKYIEQSWSGLWSNTYLLLQIQMQIRRNCICCNWSNFKPCFCICICVFDKNVFKYTLPGPFSKHKFMEHKLTWIVLINMLKRVFLFQTKCRGLTLLIPIGDCACALDLTCQ